MQLVEQRKVNLDSEENVRHILPELSRLMVLKEDENGTLDLVEQVRGITLRMLLSHTGESVIFFQILFFVSYRSFKGHKSYSFLFQPGSATAF
jgi:hypothetical protein